MFRACGGFELASVDRISSVLVVCMAEPLRRLALHHEYSRGITSPDPRRSISRPWLVLRHSHLGHLSVTA